MTRARFALLTIPLLSIAALAYSSPAAEGGPLTPEAVAIAAVAPSGEEMPVGDLPGWKQVFTDDFNSDVPLGQFPGAVSDKWGAYPYPWRDTKGVGTSNPELGGWYYPEKVVSIKGGMMDMWLHTEHIDGAQKRLVAAPVPRVNGPAPAGDSRLYGRYAVRFRSDALHAYHSAWMLWPHSNDGLRDGEIDFPDNDLDQTINGFMHRRDATVWGDQEWALSGKRYTNWHTAVIEWEPDRLAFYLDGALISNSSGGKSEWTDRIPNKPMRWILQTETSLGSLVPDTSTQGHVQIDWVAVWSPSSSSGPASCPQGQYRAEYFSNRNLTGAPASVVCEAAALSHDWATGSPPGVSRDFSARWTGTFNFPAGTRTFTVTGDDGIRVWVDGSLLIDEWRDQSATWFRANRWLSAGTHDVMVEWFDSGAEAVAKVGWN